MARKCFFLLDVLCLHIYLLLKLFKQPFWWLTVDSIKLWLWESMGFCNWTTSVFICHFTGAVMQYLTSNLKTQNTEHNAHKQTRIFNNIGLKYASILFEPFFMVESFNRQKNVSLNQLSVWGKQYFLWGGLTRWSLTSTILTTEESP